MTDHSLFVDADRLDRISLKHSLLRIKQSLLLQYMYSRWSQHDTIHIQLQKTIHTIPKYTYPYRYIYSWWYTKKW